MNPYSLFKRIPTLFKKRKEVKDRLNSFQPRKVGSAFFVVHLSKLYAKLSESTLMEMPERDGSFGAHQSDSSQWRVQMA